MNQKLSSIKEQNIKNIYTETKFEQRFPYWYQHFTPNQSFINFDLSSFSQLQAIICELLKL